MSRRHGQKKKPATAAVVGSVTVAKDNPQVPAIAAAIESANAAFAGGPKADPERDIGAEVDAFDDLEEPEPVTFPLRKVTPEGLRDHLAGVEVCARLTRHDSLRWSCACGGAGPVGRSADGIPFVTEEMLEHAPGQQKES